MSSKQPPKTSLLKSMINTAVNNTMARSSTPEMPGAAPAPNIPSALPPSLPRPEHEDRFVILSGEIPRSSNVSAADPDEGLDARITKITVDPSKTRMNDLHRRYSATMSGAAIEDLAQQIRASGQSVPALGWRLSQPDAEGYEYVLVYGARRRAATQSLGIGLEMLLLPAAPTRSDLVRLMHAENHGRMDYLPLEDAREYQSYLDSGAFKSQTDLVNGLGIEPTKLSRLMSLLEIPAPILDLYTDPSWMQLVRGCEIAQACKSPQTRDKLLSAAHQWKKDGNTGNPTAHLLAALKAKPIPTTSIKLKNKEGREVGLVRSLPNGDMQLVLSSKCDMDVRASVSAFLKTQFPDADL